MGTRSPLVTGRANGWRKAACATGACVLIRRPPLAGCTDARRSPTRPPEVSEKTAFKAVFMV